MALKFKTISQRKWAKGLQATFGIFAEPEGILKRLSNMLYDRRGALRVTDGSQIFTERNGELQPNDGQILDIVLYSPLTGTAPYYMGIKNGYGPPGAGPVSGITAAPYVGASLDLIHATRTSGVVVFGTVADFGLGPARGVLPFNIGSVVASGNVEMFTTVDASQVTVITDGIYSAPSAGADGGPTSGGTVAAVNPLPVGTYVFDVTAVLPLGETPGSSAPVTIVLTAVCRSIFLYWVPVAEAIGYCVYLRSGPTGTTVGRLNPSPAVPVPAAQTWYAFLNLTNTPAAVPPTGAGTITLLTALWRFDVPSYTVQLAALPAAPIIAVLPPPGGGVGSGSIPSGQNPNATPQGGVVGGLSPTPQLVPFSGSMMIACGNGYPPQYYTDGASMIVIPNTFTAEYPDWEPSVAWNTGDNIVDSVSGGVFTCTQSGVSGATRPTFNNTLNAGTADNTVVWQCIATTSTGQPLRGAAHAIVYGNSLWLANTYPTTTDDNQDGPSCIKSSDVGNFKSWNPINVAMVSLDDGDEITGLASFTVAEIGIEPIGNLIVFKKFATYQITGVFGASDFSIEAAQTDMGCIVSRSIQFLSGFGAVARLTHLGFAMFDGVGDKLFSEEIRPYIFGDQNQPDIIACDWSYIYFSKAAQSTNPPMYLCACPILAAVLSGITVQGGTEGTTFTIFVKVTKLVLLSSGEYEETAITNEFQVQSGDLSIAVQTPVTQAGIQYRVYAGTSSGEEVVYDQADSFVLSTNLPLADMTAGPPSLGAGALTRIFAYDLVQKCWAVVDLPFPISALKQIRTGGIQPLTITGAWSDSAIRRMFAGDTTWDGALIEWSFTPAEIFQQGGSGKVFYRKVVIRGQANQSLDINVSINIQGRTGAVITSQQSQLGPLQWDARVDIIKEGENANVTVSGTGQTTIESIDWYVVPKSPGAPVSAQK